MFFPCHLVHSSHLFSVPQLHLITNHLPTVYSFQVSLTHCKILTLPSTLTPRLSGQVFAANHSSIVLLFTVLLFTHSLVCLFSHSLVLSCYFLPRLVFLTTGSAAFSVFALCHFLLINLLSLLSFRSVKGELRYF